MRTGLSTVRTRRDPCELVSRLAGVTLLRLLIFAPAWRYGPTLVTEEDHLDESGPRAVGSGRSESARS